VSGRPHGLTWMQSLPLRALPGQDLRESLAAALAAHGCDAGFVIAGLGSLATTRLRFAGAAEPSVVEGPELPAPAELDRVWVLESDGVLFLRYLAKR